MTEQEFIDKICADLYYKLGIISGSTLEKGLQSIITTVRKSCAEAYKNGISYDNKIAMVSDWRKLYEEIESAPIQETTE